jgi:hypothetical protein
MIVGLVSACTKLRLGYEYADLLIVYFLDDNFDLNKEQRAQAKATVANYFQWHRKQMLPAYSQFLTQVTDKFDSCYKTYKALKRSSLVPVVEGGLTFLQGLSPEQIDAWAEKQQKKSLKLRRDFSGNMEDRLQTRYEKMVDELEDWTGPLLLDQRLKIKALNGILPWNGNFWLDNRDDFYLRLQTQLRLKAGEPVLRKILEDYYLHPDKVRSREYQLRSREFEDKLRTLVLAVYKMLTPHQKQYFITRVEKLVMDFNKLNLGE